MKMSDYLKRAMEEEDGSPPEDEKESYAQAVIDAVGSGDAGALAEALEAFCRCCCCCCCPDCCGGSGPTKGEVKGEGKGLAIMLGGK